VTPRWSSRVETGTTEVLATFDSSSPAMIGQRGFPCWMWEDPLDGGVPQPLPGHHGGRRAMTNTGALVEALKRTLKARGITYARVAAGLQLNVASVKRMFSKRDFTLQRLDEVCRIAEIDIGDLLQAVVERQAQISRLSVEQESELVSDTKLLLVALCAVGHWSVDEIAATYELSRADCIKHLVRLDRL